MEPRDLPAILRAVCARVAPVWPLESFVAVNPYFGMREHDFATVAQTLADVAGARSTMPLAFYAEALESGRITEDDVRQAAAAAGLDAAALLQALRGPQPATTDGPAVPTVADVAAEQLGEDWSQITTERVSAWAAVYFDDGQAIWRSPSEATSLYAHWRAEAEIDRTPEVMGAKGFRAAVTALPEAPLEAAREALRRLEVPADGLEPYVHRLLLRVGGWSAYAARVVWDANLYRGEQDDTLLELLCVLLSWEVALLEGLGDRIGPAWAEARGRLETLAAREGIDPGLAKELALQAAYEGATQRDLAERFEAAAEMPANDTERPKVQAVFCIDVRSEVFRRHFEAADPGVETLGFAGFFAFPIAYAPLAHPRPVNQCPVLLTPAHEVEETLPTPEATERAVHSRTFRRNVERAWTAFKMGAISCFSFVGPIGLAYLPKLFTDGFGLTRPVAHPASKGLDAADAAAKGPRLAPREVDGVTRGIPLESRVELAAGALGAMSLTDGFAQLVLITGHGSTTVNNPHATGLDCGACGGRTGEANARVAAATLNDPEVRAALGGKGIVIPEDTVFVAAQHDTCTDQITIFDREAVPASHAEELARVEGWLAQAGRATRAERAGRLYLAESDVDAGVLARSRDWAQTRPEWGLAGCSAFVVAPRHRTAKLDLGGRSFLHSYAWQQDEGYGVLELIMTAPMVVASWISLQYYASTVDNRVFGSGNKTLHNVVGAVGVLEGNAGDLRVGLPWQSVHDGQALQHEPLRLNVVIEAPREAMTEIIRKHVLLQELLDNGWLHLFAMNERGTLSHRYAGGLRWQPLDDQAHLELAEQGSARVPSEPSAA